MYPVHPFPFSTELEGAHPLRFCQRAGSYDRTATNFPVVSAALIAPAHHAALQASMDRRFFPFVPRSSPTKRPRYHPRREKAFSLRVLRPRKRVPTRCLGVWLFLTHLSRTSCPREPASFVDEGSQPARSVQTFFSSLRLFSTPCISHRLSAGSRLLRVTDFPMLHSPFATCASSIVTSSVKSCATPSSA